MSLRSDFPNIDFYSHRQSDLAIIESLPILRGSTSCELAVNIWEVEPRGTSDLPKLIFLLRIIFYENTDA